MILRFFVMFLFLLLPLAAQAKEVIHNYHSRIEIQQDGWLMVTETINVNAEGNEIKRGIYRDFPATRTTFLGGKLPSEYKILSVKKDGAQEPWHTDYDKDNDNLRLYIGKSDVFLPTGRYTYEITYSIPKQVFFFDSYDEIYWNAIGTGWIFPIEQASAEIILPQGANITQYSAYTGAALSTAQNFTAEKLRNTLLITTTQPLNQYEGLTVAVAFPKGVITPSPDMIGTAFFWKQHQGLPLILFTLLMLCGYYYFVWVKFGKDPKSQGLAPFYDAPAGISPAMAAYIHSMGDCGTQLSVTTVLVSLASKGFINVTEEKKGTYVLEKLQSEKDKPEISDEERVLLSHIGQSLTIRSGSENLVGVSSRVEKALKENCAGAYFHNNTKWWLIGFVIFFAGVGSFAYTHHNPENVIIGFIFTTMFGGVSLTAMIYGLKQLFTAPGLKKAGALFIILWAAGFSIGGFLGLYFLQMTVSWLVIAVFLMMPVIIIKMRKIMKTYTLQGREVADHLKGLEYYMSAVEEKVLQKFDPPQMSRELYEKYLPYAVALGVESKWADKFALSVAGAMAVAAAAKGFSTMPHWYHGATTGGGFTAGQMVSSFGSAISAASTSSSSGSSGGGSSGGGGGGGGGGGW